MLAKMVDSQRKSKSVKFGVKHFTLGLSEQLSKFVPKSLIFDPNQLLDIDIPIHDLVTALKVYRHEKTNSKEIDLESIVMTKQD